VEKLVRSKQVQEIPNTHLHEHAYFSHGKVAFIHRVSRIFRAPRKRFSWTSPVPVAFENGQTRLKSILQNLNCMVLLVNKIRFGESVIIKELIQEEM